MREDYKIIVSTAKLAIEVEKPIIEALNLMSEHTKLTVSELTNTALKRFIAGHKDFFPQNKSAK